MNTTIESALNETHKAIKALSAARRRFKLVGADEIVLHYTTLIESTKCMENAILAGLKGA